MIRLLIRRRLPLMKFNFNHIFAFGLLTVGLLLAGCASQPDAFFSDSPSNSTGISSSSGVTQTSPNSNKTTAESDVPPEVAQFQIGDTITVTFSGLLENPLPHVEPIKEDGTIELPLIGKVKAAGKTAGQLQTEIRDLYVPMFYRHLTVTVSSGDRMIYVRGEVKGGGRIIYTTGMTVTKAITSAGDFTDFAKHSNVSLIRSNGKQIKVNCDRIFSGKDPDPPVYPGDQIIVHRRWF